MKKDKIIIVGTGSLASIIGQAISEQLAEDYQLLGFLGRDQKKTKQYSQERGNKGYSSIEEAISDKPDYIVEAAGVEIVKNIGLQVLQAGINFIPLSVGALADENFYKQLKTKAKENKSKVYIPSGAVGAFDLLSAALMMEEGQVEITSEKAPQSLNGAPFLKGRKLPEDKEQVIFKGSARQVIEHFPQNTNVAVATALVTKGVDETKVTIKSNPKIQSNIHKISLRGDLVKMDLNIELKPSKDNPKSSILAAWSVVSLLKNLAAPISF